VKRKLTCERCLGVVTSPRRGVSLDHSMSNHQASCPAEVRKITSKKKEQS